MNRNEDIVYYDFQGWPEYKMNLQEILIALGGKVEGDTISFDLNDPLMDIYPRILVDDGMGYGIDENVIVSVVPKIFEPLSFYRMLQREGVGWRNMQVVNGAGIQWKH